MTAQDIAVEESILSENDRIARVVADRLAALGIRAVNLMASPGAGKTSLVVRTIDALRGQRRIAVIEGDLATRIDADRVVAAGAPAVQINTHGGCHLEAAMVAHALDELPLDGVQLLLIENVGNLVCPLNFRLGEGRRVVVASVPEGDDKPLKYPMSFVDVDAVVLNKTDLLPYVDFDVVAFRERVRGLNPRAPIFELSCRTGEGLAAWAAWLTGGG